MTIEVKVPVLPESVTEATLLDWHQKQGESVKRDENLVDIETDKVVLEVPAPADGVLKEIRKESGDIVGAGEIVGVLDDSSGSSDDSGKDKSGQEKEDKQDGGDEKEDTEDKQSQDTGESGKAEADDEDRHGPAVTAMLAEHKLDASQIQGTGKDGRIIKEDVQKFLDQQKRASSDTAEKKKEESSEPAEAVSSAGSRQQRREPMTRLRQTIANRLVQSQQTAAILTTFNEVDLTEVMALRARHKEAFVEKHGAKLGFMSFFVKASVEALKRYPVVNAAVDGTDILYHDYQDIGIAVSSPRGLVVPVVRNCDQKNFAEIEQGIVDYAKKAQKGAITMDEMTGGTFTITNGGTFGSMLSTPIINPPQSAILGMHNIVKRPMAVDGEVKIRPMMFLALSYDHRIIDGAEAVRFLVTIKECLEDPGRLLLSV